VTRDKTLSTIQGMQTLCHLKYCPFCHEDDHFTVESFPSTDTRGQFCWKVRVKCNWCGATGPDDLKLEGTVIDWNNWRSKGE